MVFQSNSDIETKEIAKKIAADFSEKGGVIALIGDLGAGKTTFAQGFAKALGIEEKVISPTFILMRQYKLKEKDRMFFHLDLYRLESDQETQTLGLKEIFEDEKNIVLVEWAEKIKSTLPKNTLFIEFSKVDQNKRVLTLKD
jgi:tRNA threonylcarbamoyladenosine biosynthesis protein TsaE